MWERARLALGNALPKSKPSAIAPRKLLELDALHGLCAPVRAISFLPGSALYTQYLRRAMATGHPVHTARALGHVALLQVMKAAESDPSPTLDRAMKLAESTCEPALIAEIEFMRGLAYSVQFKFQAAAMHFWRAQELLSTECPGQPWPLSAARMHLGAAWRLSNDFEAIQQHMGEWLEEARARDDRYAIAALACYGRASMRLAIVGDPEAALAEIEAVMAPWPRQPFATNHYGAFLTHTELVNATPGPAMLSYMEARPELGTAFLMRTAAFRAPFLTLRIQALLLARSVAAAAERPELLTRARADHRTLASLSGRISRGFVTSAAASLALADGRRDTALVHLHEAASAWAHTDLGLAAGVRYAIATLEGGQAGQSARAEVIAKVRREGWQDENLGLNVRLLLPRFLLE